MKTIQTILLSCTTAVLLLASCIREGEITPQQDEQAAIITLGAGSRAAGDASGTAEDYYINSLRILGYRTSDGTLAFNKVALAAPGDGIYPVEKRVQVLTGNFTIILIANEHEDAALSTSLSGINPSTNNTLSYLRTLSFSHTAFDKTKDIPMVAICENIVILEDDKLVDPTQNSGNPIAEWPVSLTRLGVRVDVKLKLTDAQMAAWQTPVASANKVYFNNVPTKAYIFPNIDNSDAFVTADIKFATLTTATPAKEGDLNVFEYQRVILPESSSPNLTEAQALTMKIMEDASPRTGALVSGVGTNGYTIPRNHYLDVTATVPISGVMMTLDTTIAEWNDVNISGELEGPIVP